MKFELKTENESYSKSFSHLFFTVSIIALLIIFCDVALKLGIISRHYQIYDNCRILSLEKTTTNIIDSLNILIDKKLELFSSTVNNK